MRPVLLIVAAFAVVALLLAWTRWLAGRPWAAAGNLALGLTATGLTALGWPVAVHLDSYEAQPAGQPIAELFLEQTGSRRFRATLTRFPSGRMQVFELHGEQWHVEARTLEWVNRAAELGIAPSFRLERLISQTTSPAEGDSAAPTTFALSENPGVNLWAIANVDSRVQKLLDARLQASPWQPMTHGARFELRLGPVGLEASALNVAATDSQGASR